MTFLPRLTVLHHGSLLSVSYISLILLSNRWLSLLPSRNLLPKKDKSEAQRPLYRVLLDITWLQWALVFSGWLAWTSDAMDFFSVSLAIPTLSQPTPTGFGRDTATLVCLHISLLFNLIDISQSNAVTLTLLFRSFGAVRLCSFRVRDWLMLRPWPRYFLVSCPIGMVVNGLWSATCCSVASFRLALLSVTHTSNFSPLVHYLVLLWVGFGVLPWPPHSKMCQLIHEALYQGSCNRVTQSDTCFRVRIAPAMRKLW